MSYDSKTAKDAGHDRRHDDRDALSAWLDATLDPTAPAHDGPGAASAPGQDAAPDRTAAQRRASAFALDHDELPPAAARARKTAAPATPADKTPSPGKTGDRPAETATAATASTPGIAGLRAALADARAALGRAAAAEGAAPPMLTTETPGAGGARPPMLTREAPNRVQCWQALYASLETLLGRAEMPRRALPPKTLRDYAQKVRRMQEEEGGGPLLLAGVPESIAGTPNSFNAYRAAAVRAAVAAIKGLLDDVHARRIGAPVAGGAETCVMLGRALDILDRYPPSANGNLASRRREGRKTTGPTRGRRTDAKGKIRKAPYEPGPNAVRPTIGPLNTRFPEWRTCLWRAMSDLLARRRARIDREREEAALRKVDYDAIVAGRPTDRVVATNPGITSVADCVATQMACGLRIEDLLPGEVTAAEDEVRSLPREMRHLRLGPTTLARGVVVWLADDGQHINVGIVGSKTDLDKGQPWRVQVHVVPALAERPVEIHWLAERAIRAKAPLRIAMPFLPRPDQRLAAEADCRALALLCGFDVETLTPESIPVPDAHLGKLPKEMRRLRVAAGRLSVGAVVWPSADRKTLYVGLVTEQTIVAARPWRVFGVPMSRAARSPGMDGVLARMARETTALLVRRPAPDGDWRQAVRAYRTLVGAAWERAYAEAAAQGKIAPGRGTLKVTPYTFRHDYSAALKAEYGHQDARVGGGMGHKPNKDGRFVSTGRYGTRSQAGGRKVTLVDVMVARPVPTPTPKKTPTPRDA